MLLPNLPLIGYLEVVTFKGHLHNLLEQREGREYEIFKTDLLSILCRANKYPDPKIGVASRSWGDGLEDPHGRKHHIPSLCNLPAINPKVPVLFGFFATLSLGLRRADVGVHGASHAACC